MPGYGGEYLAMEVSACLCMEVSAWLYGGECLAMVPGYGGECLAMVPGYGGECLAMHGGECLAMEVSAWLWR